MQKLRFICSLLLCCYTPALLAMDTDTTTIDKAYIAGFLAGAQLTDGEIIRRFDDADNGEQHSDFFQRAFKTRVGERNTVPATYFAGFCLPEDAVNETVIDNIHKAIQKLDSTAGSSRADLVFKAVQDQYPCR